MTPGDQDEMDAAVLEAVAEAKLHYTSDAGPGIRRIRSGRGFRYEGPKGGAVEGATKTWIRSLVIPPAWSDVWICTDPRGHLLATGRDARGRKQYRYHPEWRRVRDGGKFGRMLEFGEALGGLRTTVDEHLRLRSMGRERVLALVVRLLDATLIRVGNAEYAATNGSYGLTTLRPEHAAISGRRVVFCFDGKSGREHEIEVRDAGLARAVRRCHELGGQELFAYEGERGDVVDVSSTDVNEYLREISDLEITAKDFRTWGGTVIAAGHLAKGGPPDAASTADIDARVLDAIDLAAAALGNTRAVCRASYVHPVVPEAFSDASLAMAWATARAAGNLDREERLVLRLLDPAGPTGGS